MSDLNWFFTPQPGENDFIGPILRDNITIGVDDDENLMTVINDGDALYIYEDWHAVKAAYPSAHIENYEGKVIQE